MNAILVFDPSNDLVFSKSNKLFRTRVLKYSKLQGLIAGAGPRPTKSPTSTSTSAFASSPLTGSTTTTTTSSSSSSASSSTSASSSRSASPLGGRHRCGQTGASAKAARALGGRRAPGGGRRRCTQHGGGCGGSPAGAAHLLNAGSGQLDTNKRYLEILMLLLTPYVASLRLNGHIRERQAAASRRPPTQAAAGRRTSAAASGDTGGGGDLLSKFMSSIQVNHECRRPFSEDEEGEDAGLANDDGDGGGDRPWPTPEEDEDGDEDHVDWRRNSSAAHEFAPRRFSQFQVPVECLADCQIVYCELFDFIFIYMQQLDQLSSFKMRLLQKRIDLFARLALLLFGPSLNSMRSSGGGDDETASSRLDQGNILRTVYDVWLEHQFEAQFLLEANERLMVGRPIEQHCRETLRKLSIHLRRCSGQRETHQHALLYSDTKLTYNIHHDNELDNYDGDVGSSSTSSFAAATPTYCYASNFNTNRRTSEIHATTSKSPPASFQPFGMTAKSGGAGGSEMRQSRMRRRRRRRRDGGCLAQGDSLQTLSSSSLPTGMMATTATTTTRQPLGDKLPSQFLIFLSTPGRFKDRLRVPHMLRLVPLARGVTLIIISEISTSYLSLQLNRVLKILLELTGAQAGQAGSAAPAAVMTSTKATKPPPPPPPKPPKDCCQVKLSQLAKINDCVCAIKSYFNGQNYDLIDHHQHSGVGGGQPVDLDSSRAANSGAISRSASRSASSSAAAATGALNNGNKQQQQRQSNLVNLFSRWYASGSNKCTALDDQTSETEQKIEPSSGSELPAIGGVGGGGGAKRIDPTQTTATTTTVYESLDEPARRQCCQLVCRLEDLVSNNMHTYMRRTFNLPVEERKREALLNSVCLVLRESLDTFVFRPQMRLLSDERGPYMRLFSELVDQVRLMASEHLSDYLDYLATKAVCNVTLGAPLTHDMLAIRSFIYVDRSRQEMLVSPMQRSSMGSRMDRDSMLEVDFSGAISAGSTDHLANSKRRRVVSNSPGAGLTSSDSSGGSGGGETDDESEAGDEADDSSTGGSSGGSIESVIYRPSLSGELAGAPLKQKQQQQQQHNQRLEPKRRVQSQWLIGTSEDLITANELGGSQSGQSLNMGSSSIQSNLAKLGLGGGSTSGDLMINMSKKTSSLPNASGPQQQANSLHLVDETLMKGFTCFIYNRLAKGKTSFTSNDVELDARRKLEVARQLEATYRSLPSVVCGDFFGSYARSLFGAPEGEKKVKKSRRSKNKLVEVACKISELDVNNGNRLVQRRLSQMKNLDTEEEEDEEDSDVSSDSNSDSSENDFGLFLQNQVGSRARGNNRTRFTIQRQAQASRPAPIRRTKRAEAGQRREAGPQCYELFCIHQASLLVHRQQVLVEAERLARRLGQLCSGEDG